MFKQYVNKRTNAKVKVVYVTKSNIIDVASYINALTNYIVKYYGETIIEYIYKIPDKFDVITITGNIRIGEYIVIDSNFIWNYTFAVMNSENFNKQYKEIIDSPYNFKIGDYVRVLENNGCYRAGNVYKITKMEQGSNGILYYLDDHSLFEFGKDIEPANKVNDLFEYIKQIDKMNKLYEELKKNDKELINKLENILLNSIINTTDNEIKIYLKMIGVE